MSKFGTPREYQHLWAIEVINADISRNQAAMGSGICVEVIL